MSHAFHGPEFKAQWDLVTGAYNAKWKAIDTELYELCGRRNHGTDFADTYTKVAIIGRVYSAGIARSWAGMDPEAHLTRLLVDGDLAGLIDNGLTELAGKPFDTQSAASIIRLHDEVTSAIRLGSGKKNLTSFVSKYLHFHCPIVPIYDSRARNAIQSWVDSQTVRQLSRTGLGLVHVSHYEYFRFVRSFLVLFEKIKLETDVNPTVKELDQFLLEAKRI